MTASGCSAACDAFDSGNVKVVVGLAPTAAVALKEKDRHGEGYAFVPVGQRRGRSPSSCEAAVPAWSHPRSVSRTVSG